MENNQIVRVSNAHDDSSSSSCSGDSSTVDWEDDERALVAQPPASSLPTDQERQILMLMLLAQVCALHDPTPRTFTVHILELFERGILDHQSIRFLYDLGLVPKSPLSTEIVPKYGDRSQQASAIRSQLQNQHKLSWSVDEHPLSLSRYQREFQQLGLLSSGSFGEVFSARNKLDNRSYAVKRIPFDASGYSKESLAQVMREVHCLALCDHPHVVRYYTSWLEPEWMTGRNTSSSNPVQRKLLTGIQQIVNNGSSAGLSDDLKGYFRDPVASVLHRRRSSFDSSSIPDEDLSEWPIDKDQSVWTVDSKDDEYVDGYRSRHPKVEKKANYRYQICLFIQMQLCHPATLADWIREANERQTCFEDRIGPAIEIFHQIASGLSHVHDKLVHRDLKPANIFADLDGKNFMIGDFGLSKLILNPPTNAGATSPTRRHRFRSLQYELEGDKHFAKPMTAGIGTASYAAPEQVASRNYGTAADIFSCGLMLLEMLCPYSTAHERMHLFHDCRHRRELPQCFNEHPLLAQTILACTASNSKDRPTARDLLGIRDKLFPTNDRHTLAQENIEELKRQLAQAHLDLANCRAELKRKDLVILELRRHAESKTQRTGKIIEYPRGVTPMDSHTEVASASSTSEEGI